MSDEVGGGERRPSNTIGSQTRAADIYEGSFCAELASCIHAAAEQQGPEYVHERMLAHMHRQL